MPPPVVIGGVRCWRCFLPELPLPSHGMGVARMELVALLVFCNSSCLMCLAMMGLEKPSGAQVYAMGMHDWEGKFFELSCITSIRGRDE